MERNTSESRKFLSNIVTRYFVNEGRILGDGNVFFKYDVVKFGVPFSLLVNGLIGIIASMLVDIFVLKGLQMPIEKENWFVIGNMIIFIIFNSTMTLWGAYRKWPKARILNDVDAINTYADNPDMVTMLSAYKTAKIINKIDKKINTDEKSIKVMAEYINGVFDKMDVQKEECTNVLKKIMPKDAPTFLYDVFFDSIKEELQKIK